MGNFFNREPARITDVLTMTRKYYDDRSLPTKGYEGMKHRDNGVEYIIKNNTWELSPHQIVVVVEDEKLLGWTRVDNNHIVITCEKAEKIMKSGKMGPGFHSTRSNGVTNVNSLETNPTK